MKQDIGKLKEIKRKNAVQKFKKLAKKDGLGIVLMPALYFTPEEWGLINEKEIT